MNPHHSDDEELMQQALKALDHIEHFYFSLPTIGREAVAALRERLAQPVQEPVAHCEAGPEHCPVCLKESSPAQQPVQKPEPPPWWPAVENILDQYGLQAIDFVADFKEAMKQAEQEPIKESSVTHSHLWIGDLYGKEKNA